MVTPPVSSFRLIKVIPDGRITEQHAMVELDDSVKARIMMAKKQDRAKTIKEWACMSEMLRMYNDSS